MFARRNQPKVVIQPQFVFYAGPEEERPVYRRGFTARDWKMLWVSYCIAAAIVILSVYVCVASTDPIVRHHWRPSAHVSRSANRHVVK